jgi:hypothetical protein
LDEVILCAEAKKNLDAMMGDLMKIVDASFYLNVP